MEERIAPSLCTALLLRTSRRVFPVANLAAGCCRDSCGPANAAERGPRTREIRSWIAAPSKLGRAPPHCGFDAILVRRGVHVLPGPANVELWRGHPRAAPAPLAKAPVGPLALSPRWLAWGIGKRAPLSLSFSCRIRGFRGRISWGGEGSILG